MGYVTKKVAPTKVLNTSAIQASGDKPAWNRPGMFLSQAVVEQSDKVRRSWDNAGDNE
jgi:hypothetical protein